MKKWKSHVLRDDDPNHMDPMLNAINAMPVAAGGGRGMNLCPKDAARVNRNYSAGLKSNVVPVPSDNW